MDLNYYMLDIDMKSSLTLILIILIIFIYSSVIKEDEIKLSNESKLELSIKNSNESKLELSIKNSNELIDREPTNPTNNILKHNQILEVEVEPSSIEIVDEDGIVYELIEESIELVNGIEVKTYSLRNNKDGYAIISERDSKLNGFIFTGHEGLEIRKDPDSELIIVKSKSIRQEINDDRVEFEIL